MVVVVVVVKVVVKVLALVNHLNRPKRLTTTMIQELLLIQNTTLPNLLIAQTEFLGKALSQLKVERIPVLSHH